MGLHSLIHTTHKNKLIKISLKRGHWKKKAIISPFRTNKNVQHTTYHILRSLIHTTHKNRLIKISLKRGHWKKGHNFPFQNQQKRTAYNLPHTTFTDTYNTQKQIDQSVFVCCM